MASYGAPILAGLLIATAGLVPWTLLAETNARVRPDLPWAAIATLGYLAILIAWLHGSGPPKRTSAQRRQRLRLWPPRPADPVDAGGLTAGATIALLAVLAVLYVAIGRTIHTLGDLAHVYFGVASWGRESALCGRRIALTESCNRPRRMLSYDPFE